MAEINDNLQIMNQNEIRLGDADNSNYMGFKAPSTVTSNVTLTLPNGDGTANQVMKTNGSGVLSWTSPAGSSPLTTKGDVYVYSTTDARLPVGTDGQVLSADSTQTTGLKWITSSSSAKDTQALTWMDTACPGSATVQIGVSLGGIVVPWAGRIVAVSIGLSTPRTAGTLTARFKLNGVSDTTNTVVIDGTHTTTWYSVLGTPVSLSAGDNLTAELVGSSFTPTAADPTYTVWIERT